MLTIDKQQYEVDILAYADSYINGLRQSLVRTSAYIDESYVKDVLQQIGSFAALVRQECIYDMTLLHTDINAAKIEMDAYNDFGQYCFSKLYEAKKATDNALMLNNQLCYELSRFFDFDTTCIAVASNYIAFNLFDTGCTLELTNFKHMSGIGLCFDILLRQPPVCTTNIQERINAKLISFEDIAKVLASIRHEDKATQLIDDWSSIVNDKLQQIKLSCGPAWHATYQAYKAVWKRLELTKQNQQTYCCLSIQDGRFTESLIHLGRIRRLDYGANHMSAINLDYINDSNFKFMQHGQQI